MSYKYFSFMIFLIAIVFFVTGCHEGETPRTISATSLPAQEPALSYEWDFTGTEADFGDINVGSASLKSLKLFNRGNANLTITNAAIMGSEDFMLVNRGCDVSLAPGTGCNMGITAKPLSGGIKTGLLIIESDAGNLELALKVNAYPGGIDLSPNAISFGEQKINTTTEQAIKITNMGADSLSFLDITISGDGFSINDGCRIITPGDSCLLTVKFEPSVKGIYSELLILQSYPDEMPTLKFTVPLTGEGIIPEIAISEKAFDFGAVIKGTTANKSLTIKNAGKDDLIISDLELSTNGPFIFESNECVKTLARGEECALNIRFSPTEYGKRNTSITIHSNDLRGNAEIDLTGIGSGSELIAPNELDFGKAKTSVTKTITLKNIGYEELIINKTTIEGSQFSIINSNCSSLGYEEECSLEIGFIPPHIAEAAGNLTISYNSETFNVALTGEGIAPKVTLSAETIDFGNFGVNTARSKEVTVMNIGTDILQLTAFNIIGNGYLITDNNCGDIAPGDSCRITLELSITDMGSKTGRLTFKSNDPVKPEVSIELTGIGILARLMADPANIIFNHTPVGLESEFKTIILTNIGNTDIIFNDISVDGEEFLLNENCAPNLTINSQCAINVKFAPKTAGDKSGNLRIISSDVQSPIKSVPLSGRGTSPAVSLSDTSLDFGMITMGQSVERNVFVTNIGEAALTINNTYTSDLTYTVSHNTCSTLMPGEHCSIAVNFKPVTLGNFSGSLTIETNDGNHIVNFSGSSDVNHGSIRFTSSRTWMVPTFVQSVRIEMVGGSGRDSLDGDMHYINGIATGGKSATANGSIEVVPLSTFTVDITYSGVKLSYADKITELQKGREAFGDSPGTGGKIIKNELGLLAAPGDDGIYYTPECSYIEECETYINPGSSPYVVISW